MQMRICLYWNKRAGGGISLDRLIAIIDGAGHHVARVEEDASELPSHMDDVDCVVAAGGDGTVARAGRTLAGSPLPLAILPLGTANNIASSLAIRGEVAQLVERWHDGNVAKIDVGLVEYGDGTDRFIESVGFGLVTRCIEVGQGTLSKDDPDSHLEDARNLYLDTLRDLRPQRYQIVLDGEEMTGEFLLVEALNTPSIGPKLEFTEHVSAADGFLSVVIAAESDRAMLCAYLSALQAGSDASGRFKSWRARAISITGADRLHVDDRVIEAGGSISIGMRPLSLSILT
jgi:diacylglycerol kinase (ATP)